MARYTRTAGAKEAKTSPSRSKSRAAKPQLTKPKLGQGKRGLSESETVRQGLMKGMKEFPPWADPAKPSGSTRAKKQVAQAMAVRRVPKTRKTGKAGGASAGQRRRR